MSSTQDQTNVMIGYLLQVMYERGEMLRKDQAGSKEGERHANIIHGLARSISILREDFGYYDRKPDAQPDAPAPEPEPDAPQVEPAEWDQERQEIEEPKEV